MAALLRRLAGLHLPVLVGLLACEPEAAPEPGDSAEAELPPLASPAVAFASPTSRDAFKSTCAANLQLVDGAGTVVTNLLADPFVGGRWTSWPIVAGTQLVATLEWSDCVNTDNGNGTFSSSTFSGEEGDFFAVHYDGVDAGFEWMVQRVDFEGGAVHVQLAEGATQDDVAAYAQSMGLTHTADPADPTFAFLNWTDTTGVADVLANAGTTESIAWAEPKWIEKPAWW